MTVQGGLLPLLTTSQGLPECFFMKTKGKMVKHIKNQSPTCVLNMTLYKA